MPRPASSASLLRRRPLAALVLAFFLVVATASSSSSLATSSLAESVAPAPSSAPSASSSWTAPAFCKGNECAMFSTLPGGTSSFEIREYSPATWSTTTFPAGTPWNEVRSEGFDRNFNYIRDAGVAMTSPVVTKISGDGSYSVSFLVPSEYGTSPPAPKADSQVKIEQSPERKVVVRSWVGASPKSESREDVDAAFAALLADADAAGLIVGAPPKDGGVAGWTAGYDSPMTPESQRRHEVWLPLVATKIDVAPAPGLGGGGGFVPAATKSSVAVSSAGKGGS